MNNKNKILVGCLALLLVLSVGYALFSETITINGTATAKGDFDITVSCETGISNKLGTAESLGLNAEGGYGKESCSVDDNVVTYDVELLYPGATRYITVKMTNNGSISATTNIDISAIKPELKLCYSEDINDVDLTDNNCMVRTDAYRLSFVSRIEGTDETLIVKAGAYPHFLAISNEKDEILSNSEIMNFYDSANEKVTFPPGYSGYIVLENMVDSDDPSGVLNAKLSLKLDFEFVQSTN